MATDVVLFGVEYQKRTELGSDGNECAVCGRPIRRGSLMVEADEVTGSDMGWYPIGPECAGAARQSGFKVESNP